MMKQFLVLLGFLIFLAACKQEAKQQATENAAPEANAQTTESSVTSGSGKLILTCESNGTATNVPNNAIYAIADDRKTKIMNITAACSAVTPENYASYGIPADAIAAIGSWFAGIGDYFYAKQEGDKIVVYHTVIAEEGPPGGIHTYYPVANYESGKITVLPQEQQ